MTREEELQQAVDNISESHKYEGGIDYVTTKIAPIVVECADKKLDLSSLWHDASEEPEGYNRAILYQDAKGDCWVENMFLLHITWNEYIRVEMVDKWAYIKDLLPKGGEE